MLKLNKLLRSASLLIFTARFMVIYVYNISDLSGWSWDYSNAAWPLANIDHNLPLGDPPAESAQTGLGIKSLDKIRFSILEAGSGKL